MANTAEEVGFWLHTVFQNAVEVSLQLSRSPAPEETPFVHKYEAIETLKELLGTPCRYHFITQCLLGELYNDVEQLSDSLRSYQHALEALALLAPQEAHGFYQYLIVVYNMLGLSHINREDNEQGLACLAKAEQVYRAFRATPGPDCYHNRSFEGRGRAFRLLCEGGIDHEQVEDSYTLTQFYLAQAYTKMGLKDLAGEYCGLTLQRQHESGKYELKDFVNNLTGLSEYYQGNSCFAQAQYLLMLALRVIPEGSKRKLRASVHISLGNLLCELLDFSCRRLDSQLLPPEHDQLVARQAVLFREFDQPFPHLALPTGLEGCKSLFRQANTQFKKALEVFVLDGYVTEHIEVLFSQSRLYRSLALLEKSAERKASMLEKRREMLEPLLTELNPKAYPATWQKILVEVSEVVNELFGLRVALLGAKGFPGEERLAQSVALGRRSEGYYRDIIRTLEEDSDTPRNEQYFRSIINSKINIAKAASKLMSSDRKQRVEFLKESWRGYQDIIAYIEKAVPADIRAAFEKEVELTREMIAMMPAKIDRVNFGPLTLLE